MSVGHVYHIISLVCYSLGGLSFAIAVFLFFRLRIVNVMNILSGRKLKKDMDRLSRLSGSASESVEENTDTGSFLRRKRQKKSSASDTDTLYDLSAQSSSGSYETEDWNDGSSLDTEALDTYEGTEELNVVLTEASDTELL